MPLDVCGADSQGGLGYMIQQSLENELFLAGRRRAVISLVTQVRVNSNDAAFHRADKPIGPFYDAVRAEQLRRERGWTLVEDARRGFRRAVPSPNPLEIVEEEAIRTLLDTGFIVIALGGGGIPVIRRADGTLEGVEAVVDKDRASMILARDLRIRTMVIVTGIDRVRIGFGTPEERPVSTLTLAEARRYHGEGEFPAGSMGPKIEAACDFLASGGQEVLICSPQGLDEALAGRAGTRIVV
jgi:carbamate kinase